MLAKTKLNIMEVLSSRPLIDSYISLHEFVSVNKTLTGYYDIKEPIKNLKTSAAHQKF